MSTTSRLIDRVRARLVVVGAIEDLERAMPWGVAAALATFAAERSGLTSLGPWSPVIAGAAVAAAFPVLRALTRRRDDRAVAAAADERLGLAERLSTSLWFQKMSPAEAASFGPLVVADADSAASRVHTDALDRAFRPRMLQRPLFVAAGLLAAAGVYVVWTGGAVQAIVETDAERIARIADANRVAEVARKIQEAAKKDLEKAEERKESEFAKLADQVKREITPLTRATAPPKEEAMRQINALADLAKEKMRRMALTTEPMDAMKMAEADKMLSELLADLAKANLETLEKDLKALEEALKKGDQPENALSSQDLRDMAKRIDALKKAMERAAQDGGSSELMQQLRSFGNEELLSKIAERMRQIAARLDKGEQYSDLQGAEGEEMDLSELSEEELQQLLKDLDELANMEDLEKMLRNGNGELSGGRKLRLGGSGGS